MKRFWRSPIVLGGFIGFLGACGLLAGVFGNSTARLSDRLFLTRDADPGIVIIAIDDASLERIGRWPWDRDVHATLINQLTTAGVKAIGYDVNFPEASTPAHDQALATAIRKAGNVVLPIELPLERGSQGLTYNPQQVVRPIPLLLQGARASGHSNTPLEADGVARRIPLQVEAADGSPIPAFAYAVGSVAEATPSLGDIPRESLGFVRVHFPDEPRKAFPFISAADVVQGTIDLRELRNKIVFIGATAHDLHDEFYVPTSGRLPMSGVEIHASFLDTLIQRDWLRPVSLLVQALALIGLGLFLGLLFAKARFWVSLPVAIWLWLAWIGGAFILFDQGYLIDLVWPTLVLIFGALALSIERWVTTERNKGEIRELFGRYVSPTVLDALLRDPGKVALGGEKRLMTMLFSDLRGFTTMSEGMTPEMLIQVLNIYLTEMTDLVFHHKGVLDKYIGDAVMAFWNAPLDEPKHALYAAQTALDMRRALDEMNRREAFGKGIMLRVGIGLNTGEVIVGNVGSLTRHDYTVIGDNVNLASRVEGLNKEYGTEILVTEATAVFLRDEYVLRQVDRVAVKGKKSAVNLYELVDESLRVTSSETHKIERFEEAFRLYTQGMFNEALQIAETLLEQHAGDGPTKLLIERANYFLDHPPGADWNGVWVMTKK